MAGNYFSCKEKYNENTKIFKFYHEYGKYYKFQSGDVRVTCSRSIS